MKTSFLLFCCSRSLLFAVQTPFVNLDFESANLPYVTNASYIVSASDAFPGWTVWENENVRTDVGYNGTPVPGGQVAIFATGLYPFFTLGGLFMAHFTPWVDADCSLTQIGTVPQQSQWLEFRTYHLPDYDPLIVSFQGHSLPLFVVASEDPFEKTLRADISGFAGTTGELRFNVRPVWDSIWLRADLDIDDIQFVPVPEPQTWLLFGLGALVFVLARRRRKGT